MAVLIPTRRQLVVFLGGLSCCSCRLCLKVRVVLLVYKFFLPRWGYTGIGRGSAPPVIWSRGSQRHHQHRGPNPIGASILGRPPVAACRNEERENYVNALLLLSLQVLRSVSR